MRPPIRLRISAICMPSAYRMVEAAPRKQEPGIEDTDDSVADLAQALDGENRQEDDGTPAVE